MAKKTPKGKAIGGQTPQKMPINTEKKEAPMLQEQKLQAPTVVVDIFEIILGNKSVFIAAAMQLFLLLILFSGFLFGDRLFLFKDIGSDTINVFYPQLVQVADYLAKDGLPKWSFTQGMGQNILPLSIGDPFNWLLYTMGKNNLAYGIVWVEMLKLFSAGMLFYGYLRSLRLTYHSAILGGLAYSFCGFMVVGSGWYVFSTQGVFFALFLWGFERLFQQKSWWMFTLATFLISINLPFDLYLAVVFIFCYSTLRLIEEHGKDFKKYLFVYLMMFGCGALAVLMSMGLFISSVDQILNSPRVSGESAFFESLRAKSVFAFVEPGQGVTALGRIFANDLLGDANYNSKTGALNFTGWNNYLEAPALYSGLFSLLLIPQAIALSKGRKRMLYIVGLMLVILPIMFPYLRYAFWLFAGDYYRTFTLFFSIAFIFVAMQALDLIYKLRKVNLFVLVGTLVLLIAMMFIPFADAKIQMGNTARNIVVDGSLRNILLMFLLAQTFVIAGLGFIDYRQTARIAMLGLVALECLLVSSYTYNSNRPVITKTEFTQKVGYNDATVEAIKLLKQKDPSLFYRIEKSYKSGVAMHGSTNDAKAQDYFGSMSYHSFNQPNYIRFLAETDVIDPKDENQTRWASGVVTRPLLQIISSTKYLLVQPNNNMPKFWFNDFDSVGSLKIWSNPYYLPLGFTYDKILEEAVFQKLSKEGQSLKKQIALLKAMTIDTKDKAAFAGLSAFDTAVINTNYMPEELAIDVNSLRADTLKMEKFSQNKISGTIKTSKAKALFFSIPFDHSWSATVDGKAAKLYRANLGLMALPLSAGEHKLVLQFTPPYWTLSWLLSGLGFLIFFGGLAFTIVRNRSKTKSAVVEPLETEN